MTPAQLLNLQTVHARILAGQRRLLDHMVERPEAYRTTPEGLCAYREISAAAELAWSMIETSAVQDVGTNG